MNRPNREQRTQMLHLLCEGSSIRAVTRLTGASKNTVSNLMISWLVGGRDSDFAMGLMDDLKSRLANRVQLTSDGHKAYLEAVEGTFGGDVDYAQLVKIYGASPEGAKGRYSPAECIGAEKSRVTRSRRSASPAAPGSSRSAAERAVIDDAALVHHHACGRRTRRRRGCSARPG